MPKAPGQDLGISIDEPIEEPVEPGLVMAAGLNEGVNRDRGHGHRRHVGGQHRKGDGERQGDKQEADDPGKKHDREIHDQNTDRDHQHGERHLVGAVAGRLRNRLPHAEVPKHVFQHHDVVIQERADHQCQATQGHHVDRLACEAQLNEGGKNREGDCEGNDECGAQVSQE